MKTWHYIAIAGAIAGAYYWHKTRAANVATAGGNVDGQGTNANAVGTTPTDHQADGGSKLPAVEIETRNHRARF